MISALNIYQKKFFPYNFFFGGLIILFSKETIKRNDAQVQLLCGLHKNI